MLDLLLSSTEVAFSSAASHFPVPQTCKPLRIFSSQRNAQPMTNERYVSLCLGSAGPLVRESTGHGVHGCADPRVCGSAGPGVRGSARPRVRGSTNPRVRRSRGPRARGSERFLLRFLSNKKMVGLFIGHSTSQLLVP